MLEEINISGLGVIDSSTLELGPGLTVITGETGAGKTMVVTALGLLLGDRGDPGAVRRGMVSARVEGIACLARMSDVVEAVGEVGGVVEDDRVVLARTVAAEGRSRAFVGGASVPVSTLGAITSPLVAVHGQSDQHRLLKPGAQRDALDRHAGDSVAVPLSTYRLNYDRLRVVERELAGVLASRLERAREADLLQFGLEEVSNAAPQAGEDLALAAQEERLAFADSLRSAAELSREALSSDSGEADALSAAAAARNLMEGVRDHDPEAAALADRLAEITYEVSDLAADVASYAAKLESDPAQLASVSSRRALLSSLTRKYGDDIDAVLEWAATAQTRLSELMNTDDRIDSLRADRSRLRASLTSEGAAVSRARAAAAEQLGAAVTAELTSLAMPHARVTVAVRQVELPPSADPAQSLLVESRCLQFTASGFDDVEFLLAANVGSESRALSKGASGGELSRVMLALEVSLAGSSSVPTFVFDEVDAGVGGKAAVEVGRRLAQLAESAQVIVVTHLPQVAAYADRHIVVEKSDDGSVTTSGLQRLDDAGRERELSRMLAGMEDSVTGLEHARELLAAAQSRRES